MSTANVSKLAIAWSFSPWGTGWSLSSPVMAGGAVYVSALRKSDNHMYLIALDPGTGSVLWNLYVGVNAPPALSGYTPPGPAVDNGLVYASYYSQSGGFTFVRIAAIDVASHLVKWTWVSPGASAFLGNSELAVSNGLLVLGFRDFVASVDATTGATLTYLLSNPSFPDRAMPVVFGTVAYMADEFMADEFMADSFPSALHAKNAKTGAWIWSNIGLSPNGVATWYANSLALSSSKLFFGANLAGLDIVHAVDTTTGGDLWYTLVDGRVYQPPAVAANTVYAAVGLTDHQTGGSLYALDATTGGLLWKTKVTEATNKFPCDCFDAGAVANGVVYVQHDGLLEAFNASTGKGLFKGKDLGLSSSPAIANGFVYVSSSQTVYAYKPFP